MARLLLLLSAVWLPTLGLASEVTGRVLDADGVPVADAYVQARAGERREIRAQTRTDKTGAYRLEAPEGPVQLEAQKTGLYVVEAGGLAAPSITKTCPAEGECGEVDFVLGPAPVIEAWLVDEYGDPVSDATVTLSAPAPDRAQDATQTWGRIRGRAASDDRGYLRFWDVPPGEYELKLMDRNMGYPGRGISYSADPQRVSVAAGDRRAEVRMALRSGGASFTISGVVKGAPEPKEGEYVSISVRPKLKPGESSFWMTSRPLGKDGSFTVPGLKKGEYVLQLTRYTRAQTFNLPEQQLLAEISVESDVSDLEFTPQPKTGVEVTVDFGEAEPHHLWFQLVPIAGAGSVESLSVRGDQKASHGGLTAGEYRLVLFSNDSYLEQDYEFHVERGRMTPLDVRIGTEFASLTGTVQLAEGAERQSAAHFTVAVKGRRRRHKVQADDRGRFVIEKLAPGDYLIAAWAKPDVDVEDDAVWRDAAGEARELRLEPGFEVEIDLTAKP